MHQNKPENNNWVSFRWLIALLGISFIVLGQWTINLQVPPDAPPLSLGTWLTQQIHLGDPYIDQVLNGIPIWVAGGLLLALALRGIPLLPTSKLNKNETPLEVNFLRTKWKWLLISMGFFAILLIRLGSPDFRLFETPFWLISLLLIFIVFLLWDQRRNIDVSPHISRQDLLWMIGIVGIGVVIGAFRLQGLPDQLIGDDGSFWSVARDIATNKFQPSIFAPGVYSFPVFSSIIQAWFLKIFGISLWGWRFSSVLTGLFTVFPLYLLTRELFERRIAIISSIVLITSPYFIDFSRLGYNNIQALFFTTLTLYWLYIGLFRRSSLYLYLAGCIAGLGFYTFFAARMALVISILFILVIGLGKKIKVPAVIHAIAILGFGFMLVVTPYFVYGSRIDPAGLSYKSFESAFFNSFNGLQFYSRAELFSVAPPIEINGNELFYNPKIYAVLITRGIIRTLLSFQKSGLISEHFIAFPLAGTIGAVFFLIGLVLISFRAKQSRSLLLILWFLVNVLGLSALNTVPPRQTHMVAIIPALAILTGIGIDAMATGASAIHPNLKNSRYVILVILIAFTVTGGLYDFFIRVPVQYHAQPGEVVSWATLESHNESIVYLYADPSQKNFVPYSEVLRSPVPYEAVSAEDVISGNKTFSMQPTLVFYPPEVSTDVTAALKRLWGDSFRSNSFYSTGGDLVLYAGMNTPFVFEKDKDLITIIEDSYLLLSLDLLLCFFLGCFIFVFFLPKKIILKVPSPLKRLVDWFNAPVEPGIVEESNNSADEFFDDPNEGRRGSEEPPAWFNKNYEPDQPPERDRFFSRFKSVVTSHSSDYYLHFHVPHFTLSGFHLPWTKPEYPVGSGLLIPPLTIPDPILLIGGVVSAITAQILISSQFVIFGILAYAVAGFTLLLWARSNPKWKNVFSNQLKLTASLEIIISSLIFLVMVVTRFFDLNTRVYGLEADETKWTVQSWYSTILRVDLGEFATMHYKYLPVDFWVRSIFLRLFGLNFISARMESAVLSLLSVIFLYLLVRLLTSSPSVSFLSALLFGLSFVELNASHQALHSTPPEAWMLSALFFLFIALKDRRNWKFQTTGILLGLGMLTYETFYPTSAVALVFLSGYAIYEVWKKIDSARNWLIRLAIVSWPVVLVYFIFTRPYLAGRQGYLFGWLNYFSGSGQDILGAIGFILGNVRDVLLTIFAHVVFTDSLINWSGSFINPLILPFVVIGLIYNIWNIRRPTYLFILLWYLFHAVIGSVILGSVWPRVMYLTLPPLMIWGALGLWTTFGAIRGFLNNRTLTPVVVIFTLLVLVILLNDYHIFTTQLVDPVERQKRRELADLSFNSAKSTPMILYPYMLDQSDSLELESHVLLYSVAGARHLGLEAADYFKQLTQDSLFPMLWQLKDLQSLDIFYDKTANSFQEEHFIALKNVLNCYPHAKLESSGRFFDVYHLVSKDLETPRCYSPINPTAIQPIDSLITGNGQPIIFKWDQNNVNTSSFAITLERKLDDIFWIEAENFQGPGWHSESHFVNDFSGTGFLMDDYHAGQANYDFNVPATGQYKVWVRFYKRQVNDQHNFLYINGNYLEFADNNSALNQWVWKDMGTFNLNTGQLPLGLARTYGLDPEYSVFIDAVVVTTDLNFQPDGEDSEWQVIKSTGEINSTAAEYPVDMDLSPGEYRWKVRIFDSDKIVDNAGARGIESDFTDFVVH